MLLGTRQHLEDDGIVACGVFGGIKFPHAAAGDETFDMEPFADALIRCERGQVRRGGVSHVAEFSGRIICRCDLSLAAVFAGGGILNCLAAMHAFGHGGIVAYFASEGWIS